MLASCADVVSGQVTITSAQEATFCLTCSKMFPYKMPKILVYRGFRKGVLVSQLHTEKNIKHFPIIPFSTIVFNLISLAFSTILHFLLFAPSFIICPTSILLGAAAPHAPTSALYAIMTDRLLVIKGKSWAFWSFSTKWDLLRDNTVGSTQ